MAVQENQYEQAKRALNSPALVADEVTVEMVSMLLRRIEMLELHLGQLGHLMDNHEHHRLVSVERERESREI